MTATDDRPPGRKLPTRLMCERYGVVDRTINRWEETGVIPQAEWINGRRYWDEAKVEKRDRERALDQTRKKQTKSIPVGGKPMKGGASTPSTGNSELPKSAMPAAPRSVSGGAS